MLPKTWKMTLQSFSRKSWTENGILRSFEIGRLGWQFWSQRRRQRWEKKVQKNSRKIEFPATHMQKPLVFLCFSLWLAYWPAGWLPGWLPACRLAGLTGLIGLAVELCLVQIQCAVARRGLSSPHASEAHERPRQTIYSNSRSTAIGRPLLVLYIIHYVYYLLYPISYSIVTIV